MSVTVIPAAEMKAGDLIVAPPNFMAQQLLHVTQINSVETIFPVLGFNTLEHVVTRVYFQATWHGGTIVYEFWMEATQMIVVTNRKEN